MVEREAVRAAGGFDERLSMCADWDLWIRLSLTLESVRIAEPLVLYRIHGSSMSTNLRVYESDARILLENAFAKRLPETVTGRRPEAEGRMWEMMAGSYWIQGSGRDAIRCVLRAIWLNPLRISNLLAALPGRLRRRRTRVVA